jgi:hypothetical protein
MKDIHSWVEPLRVVGLRLIELLDKLLKNGENAASRIAGFEPVSERVGEKIVPCAFFVRFQGIVENHSEVGRCGSRVSERHKGEVRNWREESRVVGDGEEKSDTPHKRAGNVHGAIDRRARHMTTVQRGLGRGDDTKKGFIRSTIRLGRNGL